MCRGSESPLAALGATEKTRPPTDTEESQTHAVYSLLMAALARELSFGQKIIMASMRLVDIPAPRRDDAHAAMAPTVYFTPVERLRAYLRIKNKRVRPRSHTRLKFSPGSNPADICG
jgi:hypothetical protein